MYSSKIVTNICAKFLHIPTSSSRDTERTQIANIAKIADIRGITLYAPFGRIKKGFFNIFLLNLRKAKSQKDYMYNLIWEIQGYIFVMVWIWKLDCIMRYEWLPDCPVVLEVCLHSLSHTDSIGSKPSKHSLIPTT